MATVSDKDEGFRVPAALIRSLGMVMMLGALMGWAWDTRNTAVQAAKDISFLRSVVDKQQDIEIKIARIEANLDRLVKMHERDRDESSMAKGKP